MIINIWINAKKINYGLRKKYKQLHKFITDLYPHMSEYCKEKVEGFFPELAESEDGRIRKEIISIVKSYRESCITEGNHRFDDCIAWLEKQKAKEDIDRMAPIYEDKESFESDIDTINPRFKVDDWITDGEYILKIIDIRQLDYILQSQDGKVVDDTISYVDEHFHLWTIKDARDDEVLVDDIDGRPFIFKDFSDSNHPNSPVAYCGINSECDFRVSYGSYRWTDKDVKPSTKEQRDRLF